MFRASAVGAIVFFCAASMASAQVTLQRKFVEGSQYARSVDVRSKQTMSIQGMNLESSSQQNMVVRSTIGRRDADGVLRVENRVESMQQQIKAPGLGEVSFDSVNPEKATESVLTPLLKAASQASWTLVLDRENQVVAVEGKDKAFAGLDEKLRDAVKGTNDPEYLKQATALEFSRVPSKPLKVGDTWEQTAPLRLDSAQSLTFKKKYTYKGIVEKEGRQLHQIDVEATDVKLAMEPTGPLMIKLLKSELKLASSQGTLYFDAELGQVVMDSQTNQIKGSITLGVAGQELPAEFDLTLETSTQARR